MCVIENQLACQLHDCWEVGEKLAPFVSLT